MKKKTVRDLADSELRGKRALVRADFNVPLDENGTITDDLRIRAAIPTLRFLLDKGARPVLLSHLGRPKGKPDQKYSLRPVAKRLSELLGAPVAFLDTTIGEAAVAATKNLKDGEALLLENTRFFAGEEKNEAELSKSFAQLGDFYVNDAFGAAHRAHSSTAGVTVSLQPAVAGLLMEKELDYLSRDLRESVERELAKAGSLGPGGATLDLVIEDAKPNRPTMRQMTRTPGLSYESRSLGGAQITGVLTTADGRSVPVRYQWYESDLFNTVAAGTWSDAETTFDRFARKLAKGESLAEK